MLSVHDPDKRRLEACTRPQSGSWVSAVAPTQKERDLLRELGVPDQLMTDALDTKEMSRVDHHQSGAKLFVLRVPAAASASTDVVPLGVIALPGGTIVTMSAADTGIPEQFAANDVDPAAPTRFAMELALHIAERFVLSLQAIESEIERLERKLRQALENDEILALLEQQKRLVHFDAALTANELVLERALEDAELDLEDQERVLVEDVLIEIRQAGTMTRTAKEMLEATMDALATVVSNNLNVAMKKLASLTLLVSIPAMFAGVYGMNVALPLAQHAHAFFGVLAVAGLSMVAVALFSQGAPLAVTEAGESG